MSVVGSGFAIGSAALGVGLLRASWQRRGGGRHWLTAAGWAAFVCGAGVWHWAGLGWDEGIALAMLAPSLMAFLVLARQAQWRPTAAGAGRGQPKAEAQWAIEPVKAAQGSISVPAALAGQKLGTATPASAWAAAERELGDTATPAGARAVAVAPRVQRGATRVGIRSESGGSLGRGVARTMLAGPVALLAALGLTGLVALRAPWEAADRVVAAGFVLPLAWAMGALWATMDRKLTRVAVGLCVAAVVCVGGAVV